MSTKQPTTPKFRLGKLIITEAVQDNIARNEYFAALERHIADSGHLSPQSQEEDLDAIANGNDIISLYGTHNRRFFIITNADRSRTTIRMYDDYLDSSLLLGETNTPELIVALGKIVISSEASKEFSIKELFDALQRHATCDWGTIHGQELDWNEFAAKWGGELLSRYGKFDRGLVVITDNNVTNVYTNNEY